MTYALISVQTTPVPEPVSSAQGPGRAFEAVEGGKEQHSGTTLLVEAYVVLWVILMIWLLTLWTKQRTLHARIDDLERVLDKAAAKQGK